MSPRARCAGIPHFFTSSGLGDSVVDGPRRELFGEMFPLDGDWEAAQRAFHRHSWADRPNLSVCMRRPDAATVSCTTVEVCAEHVSLAYTPGPPDRCDPMPAVILIRAEGAR